MSIKLKPIPTGKKPSACPVIKEVQQQNQIIGEILRIVISRSEDIAILKSLSDRKTSKLRVQTSYAEKTISEIDMKEEWRYGKEESLLIQLTSCKIEGLIQKKQLEKVTKKMIRINLQFEDDPSDSDMNLTEIHVQKVMSVRINSDNTYIGTNEKGQQVVSLPTLTINASTWRENFNPIHKLLESCLIGESINPYTSIFLCVKQNRTLFTSEMTRQKQAIDEGLSLMSPNFAVLITSKRSKAALAAPQKKGLSPIKKPNPLPEPDFMPCLHKMMMELNVEVDRNLKNFILLLHERNLDNPRTSRTRDPVLKTLRARNYEKFSAVNPWEDKQYSLSTVKTLKSLHMHPAVLFDLENIYFDENSNLADRIKVIHSCLVIQKSFKWKKQKELEKKIVLMQKWVRGFLARRKIVWIKTQGLRKEFYWEKLKHWYPLWVNKWKERKSKLLVKDVEKRFDCGKFLVLVVKIQKWVRGFICRKHKVYWAKVFFKLRQKKVNERFYKVKQGLWRVAEKLEGEAIRFTVGSENGANGKEACKRSYNDMIFELEKSEELENRKKVLGEARSKRIQALA